MQTYIHYSNKEDLINKYLYGIKGFRQWYVPSWLYQPFNIPSIYDSNLACKYTDIYTLIDNKLVSSTNTLFSSIQSLRYKKRTEIKNKSTNVKNALQSLLVKENQARLRVQAELLYQFHKCYAKFQLFASESKSHERVVNHTVRTVTRQSSDKTLINTVSSLLHYEYFSRMNIERHETNHKHTLVQLLLLSVKALNANMIHNAEMHDRSCLLTLFTARSRKLMPSPKISAQLNQYKPCQYFKSSTLNQGLKDRQGCVIMPKSKSTSKSTSNHGHLKGVKPSAVSLMSTSHQKNKVQIIQHDYPPILAPRVNENNSINAKFTINKRNIAYKGTPRKSTFYDDPNINLSNKDNIRHSYQYNSSNRDNHAHVKRSLSYRHKESNLYQYHLLNAKNNQTYLDIFHRNRPNTYQYANKDKQCVKDEKCMKDSDPDIYNSLSQLDIEDIKYLKSIDHKFINRKKLPHTNEWCPTTLFNMNNLDLVFDIDPCCTNQKLKKENSSPNEDSVTFLLPFKSCTDSTEYSHKPIRDTVTNRYTSPISKALSVTRNEPHIKPHINRAYILRRKS